MASGHVNRTTRPNTWQHRPSLRRDDFSPPTRSRLHGGPSYVDPAGHHDVDAELVAEAFAAIRAGRAGHHQERGDAVDADVEDGACPA